MGSFLYLCIPGLIVIAICGFVKRRRQPKEITPDEVPELVRNELQRRVPDLDIDRVIQKPHSFRFNGRVQGVERQVKIKLQGSRSRQRIYKVQIQLETRSAYRSLKGKHEIDQRDVPNIVLENARLAAEKYAEPFEKISRVKAATVQGRNAFDIRAWIGEWRFEVELLDDGEILEVELDFRPDGPRR